MSRSGNNAQQPRHDRPSWFSRIGAVAALLAGVLLLVAMISQFVSVLKPGTINGWLLPFENVWLILIFKLHAGFTGVHADMLHGLKLVDIIILALVSILCLSLSTVFGKSGKIWTLIAFAFSLAAIALYLATHLAGRSTVMLAVMIISIVMLKNKFVNRLTSCAGICASVFLFVGDMTVGIHSDSITILFCTGYVLLVAWFFLIAGSLFRSS
jgi:hypothetical protein